MTGEEWTEPTQRKNLATKATPTDADDGAKIAADEKAIKGLLLRINTKHPADPIAHKSQEFLTNSKQLLYIHLSSF